MPAITFSCNETQQKARALLSLFINTERALIQPLLTVLDRLKDSVIEDMHALRTEINIWVENNPAAAATSVGDTSLHAALHSFLVAMAAANPRNSDDPVTQEPVAEARRIVTADGYQFDASSLLTWIKTKGKMINPFTNFGFAVKDQDNIRAYAAEHEVDLRYIHTSAADAPGLLAGAVAAINRADQRLPNRHAPVYLSPRDGLFHHESERRNDLLLSPEQSMQETLNALAQYVSHDELYVEPRGFPPPDQLTQECMQETVNALAQYGLTLDYLRTHYRFHGVFDRSKSGCLIYLVTGNNSDHSYRPLTPEQCLSPAQAIAEISGLSREEFMGIYTNYAYGFRRSHLEQWRALSNGIRFETGHGKALEKLLRDLHFSPQEAVQRISGLTNDQAWDIHLERATILISNIP